jgi:lysine-ketoglutarate reductase/saccharopine dehydrogenase-like protein (TIGR00300 family)
MKAYEDIKLEGHIIDSLLLPRVLDEILEHGGEYRILRFRMGREKDDPSVALLRVSAPDESQLQAILRSLRQQGAEVVEEQDVHLEPAPADGVFPEDFYSTTNLETFVRSNGHWVPVRWPEMDCGVIVDASGEARTLPLVQVRAGDLMAVGTQGIRVVPVERDRASRAFEFMGSSISSEKPKRLVVAKAAQLMRDTRAAGKNIIAVLGPAVVHTGAAPAFARLVATGWIDVVFGGNAIAVHDIESAFFNTSLGIDLSKGDSVEGGHEHHLRAINRIRRCGGIRRGVEQGVLTSGLFYEIVLREVPYVLAGSIRDDGPLPDVITDSVEAQQAMREHVRGAGLCLMLCSMLHSIATGNLLPAAVHTICVDINPAVATKLSDRESWQTIGIVTDVGLFLDELVTELEAEVPAAKPEARP